MKHLMKNGQNQKYIKDTRLIQFVYGTWLLPEIDKDKKYLSTNKKKHPPKIPVFWF
jgi:hypothetical protein